MPQDVSGFVIPTQHFEGLYKLGDTLERRHLKEEQLKAQTDARKQASTTFLTNYLDKKDYLSGTNYDPLIVKLLQDAVQQGAALASKGADAPSIVMALGPLVNKISQYSTSAKLINQQIKDSVAKLKNYHGYNLDALQDEARNMAFNEVDPTTGKVIGLKDPTKLDPDTDWVTQAIKEKPEAVTTAAGLGEYVNQVPMSDYSRTVGTTYAGRSRQVKYEARHPYYMGLAEDDKGKMQLDAAGNPKGLDVLSTMEKDPLTNSAYRVMDKQAFSNVMKHNPGIADYIRGQVRTDFNQIRKPDQKMPMEGSPEWDTMARHILYNELQSRNKSHFKVSDVPHENAMRAKAEIGQNPELLQGLKNVTEAVKGEAKAKPTNTVEAIAKIMTHDPDYVGGDIAKKDGRSVIDVTHVFPKDALQLDKGVKNAFKQVWYDPEKRALIVQMESEDAIGTKNTTEETINEKDIPRFMTRIATANGVNIEQVRKIIDKYGFKEGKFNKPASTELEQRIEFENRGAEKIKRTGFIGKFNSMFGLNKK